MKKVLIVVLFLTVVTGVGAQTIIGVSGGLNMANISMKTGPNEFLGGEFKTNLLFNAGVFVEYGISETVGILGGVFLDQYGGKYEEIINETDYSSEEHVEAKANYLSIPIQAKIQKPMDGMSVYGLVGSYVAMFLSGKAEGEVDAEWEGGENIFEIDVDIKDGVTKTDYGIVIGGGVQKLFGNHPVSLDVRYKIGLSNDFDQFEEQLGNADLTAKSRIISVNISVGLIKMEK